MERNMPLEIIEDILLNLPVKSLLLFSAVSKSWKAMISDEKFLRQYKSRASLPGRERILFSHSPKSLMPATTRLVSSISSNRLDLDQLFIWTLKDVKFLASCSDMWCVASRGSYFVFNPSMGTYKQLPLPLSKPSTISCSEFYFGIGFDSVSDDFKILKVPKSRGYIESELYSLRSNSWRKIEPLYFLRSISLMEVIVYQDLHSNGVFVRNALHWVANSPFYNNNINGTDDTIISFDLSTEKCADFVQPPIDPREVGDEVDLTVLRGNLCLHLNYHAAKRFVLWEMQEYGDGKSWTKIMDMSISGISINPRHGKTILTPLYLYQNGLILMKATASKSATIFSVYKDKLQNIVWSGSDCGSTSGRLYVESFVSPATYS